MNWHDFLSRLGSKKPKPLVNNFDKKLVKNVHRRFLPTLAQLKYSYRFLDAWEKKVLKIAGAVMCLALIFWGSIFVIRHSIFAPKNGGEYSEAMVGQPKLINPLFSSVNDVDADLVSLVYSGLCRYDKDLKLVPDLAESYTVSDDKKIFTITLKKDIKWSDGEPFTANDILFTFDNIQNPDVGSPLYPAFQGVTIEKKDDDKIVFTLKESFAPFLNSLTVGIMPEHSWSDIAPANMKLSKNNLQPIGTGAWKFDKLLKDDTGTIQSYTLATNTKYYGKSPYLKTLIFRFVNDYQQAVDALRGQNVSAVSFIPRQLKDKLPKKNINIYPLELPQYTALFFNQSQDADLKDYDLRLALAESLDKKIILDIALQGDGIVIDSPILSGDVGYYPDIKKISLDMDAANALLDKKWAKIAPEEYFKARFDELMKSRQDEIDAITKDASSTPEIASSTIEKITDEITNSVRQEMNADQLFYRKDKNGKILSITITTADTAEYIKAGEEIAKMWRAVGIQSGVRSISSRQLAREILKPRDYQVLLYGEILGSDPDPFPFWHSSQTEYPGLNLSLFNNRTSDKLLEDARVAADPAKRDESYKKFQDILVNELPAIFLYSPKYTFAADKNIKGIESAKIFIPSDRFNNIGDWYVKTKWSWK